MIVGCRIESSEITLLIARISEGSSPFLVTIYPGGGRALPYMGNIGMCGPKGYGFSAVLVIDRVSILANFGHFSHHMGYGFSTLALI